MDRIIESIISEQATPSEATCRYKIPISEDDCRKILEWAYRAEVARSGGNADCKASGEYIGKVAKWMTDRNTKGSLMIAGTNGTGKTTLAHAMANALRTMKERYMAYLNENRYWLPPPQLARLEWWRSLPNPRVFHATEMVDVNDEARTAGMLFIDDLGVEPVMVKDYGTETTPIIDTLSYRYDRRMPTIITTNLPWNGIEQRYGKRIEGRLNELCNTLVMNGRDFRH